MKTPHLIIALGLAASAGSLFADFTYTDFSSTSGLQLNGNAASVDNVLRLTPANYWQAGSAFSTNTVSLASNASFSTFFQFNMHDVGGSSGENQVVLSIHGSTNGDQTLQMDGFPVHVYDASTSMSGIQYSDAQVQEFNFEFSAISAETGSGGVRVNVVPKEGSNKFRPSLFVNGTGRSLTSSNLTDSIKATGLTDTDHVLKIWDFNPAFGGPLVRDRVWFYGGFRSSGAQNFIAGM